MLLRRQAWRGSPGRRPLLVHAEIVDPRLETRRLIAALEQGRAEVHVVDLQRADVAEIDRDTLAASRLARLPRQIDARVLADRKAAEHRVAELMAAALARGRHH